MNITIIGGGNIGTLMAAEIADKGHCVTIYTSKVEKWNNEITVFDQKENLVCRGNVKYITDDIAASVEKAEMIFITLPPQMFNMMSKKMLPYVIKGQKIGIIPGAGGAEFAFHELIKKGCTLFGFQRVHSIARLKEYGHSVYMLGRKSEIQIGAIPQSATYSICDIIHRFFNIPCKPLPNYCCVTLTPSNPILHTTRLYAMFQDYHKGIVYPKNILFYEEWDDKSSDMLIKCDEELQKLCSVIPLDLSNVISLKKHYESDSVEAMTKKISGITAFKGLLSPMKQRDEYWIVDFSSRYFVSDFSYGLKVMIEIAKIFEAEIPYMMRVWNWYAEIEEADHTSEFELSMTKDKFISIYE